MVQTSSTYVLAAIAVSAAYVAAAPAPKSGLGAAAGLLEKGASRVIHAEQKKPKTHHVSEWGNALINGGANLGSAAIANHQQNQQMQQMQQMQQQQPQQLQQRDYFEYDSRDFDELEARAGHGLASSILHHTHKLGQSIFENAASLGAQYLQGQQPPQQYQQRDYFELDSRDFDELEARAGHVGLASNFIHHAHKLGPSIIENAASLGAQYLQGQQQPGYGQMMRRGPGGAPAAAAMGATQQAAGADPSAGASAMGGAGAASAPDMGATSDPTMGGASAAGAPGPSMAGAGGMGAPHKHGHKHGRKHGHKHGKPKSPQRRSFGDFEELEARGPGGHRGMSMGMGGMGGMGGMRGGMGMGGKGHRGHGHKLHGLTQGLTQGMPQSQDMPPSQGMPQSQGMPPTPDVQRREEEEFWARSFYGDFDELD